MLKLTCIGFACLLIISNFWMLEENGVDMDFDFKKDGLCEVRYGRTDLVASPGI